MFHKLDFLVRFWELSARHASEGAPLAQDEQLELLSLLQLVTSDLKVPEPGPAARTNAGFPAQMIGEGVVQTVSIRNVAAAALLATCASLVPHGAQVIVRVTDAVAGVEYALPCKVLWVHEGAPNTVALMVDGVPTRTRFYADADADAEAEADEDEATPSARQKQQATQPRPLARTGRRDRYERLLTWSTAGRRTAVARRQ